jgi:hypothetical protein
VLFTVALSFCSVAEVHQSAQAAGASSGTLSVNAEASTPQNMSKSVGVRRSGGASGTASVVCQTINGTAIAGRDFTAVNTTLTWADGDHSPKFCNVAINDSVPFQGKRSLVLQFSNATGAALSSSARTTVNIFGNINAGAVAVSAPAYTVKQSAGQALVTVNRVDGSAGTAVVYYATASKTAVAGTDFTSTSGSLTWEQGDTSAKTISIPVSNAKPFAGSKQLAFALAHAVNAVIGSTSSAIVTINGDGSTIPPKGGFFVSGGKLYDPNGAEFRIRGVDRCHYDSDSQPGISNSGANAVRMFMYNTSIGAAKYASVVQTQHIAYKEVPILAMPLFPDGSLTTGNTNANELAAGVDWWVANAATFTALDRYLIINIANEWGPSNSTVWRDAYISAVSKMRAAGYHGTLMIDAGGWGQDVADLLNYSTAVFNSDPDSNIIFSLHIYGAIPTADIAGDLAQLKALSTSVGMAFVVGEFGPGRNIGPSPTLTTPADVINAAEANGIGWIAWAWDDNNQSGGASNDNWFSMTFSGPGIFTSTADLTTFGKDVVLNSSYGLQTLAKPASIF